MFAPHLGLQVKKHVMDTLLGWRIWGCRLGGLFGVQCKGSGAVATHLCPCTACQTQGEVDHPVWPCCCAGVSGTWSTGRPTSAAAGGPPRRPRAATGQAYLSWVAAAAVLPCCIMAQVTAGLQGSCAAALHVRLEESRAVAHSNSDATAAVPPCCMIATARAAAPDLRRAPWDGNSPGWCIWGCSAIHLCSSRATLSRLLQ